MSTVDSKSVSVCGRAFSPGDLSSIREFISGSPSRSRREIATWTCESLGWLTPAGRLKEMSCRVALLRLEALGLIRLPAPRKRSGNRKPYQPRHTLDPPAQVVNEPVGNLHGHGLRLRKVETREDSLAWNEAVSRFHYLGYQRLPGAQLRYVLEWDRGLLGVLGFGGSAWKVAARDQWIGWSEEERRGRLHLVVNNARFLLLPWVESRNLASWVLSRCARRLPMDWEERYGYRPVLLETFVERDRFHGTCYKASNWKCVGETRGRGKLDRYRRAAVPVKEVYVYPLAEDFRKVLCA